MFLAACFLIISFSIVIPAQIPEPHYPLQNTPPRLTLLLESESLFTTFEKLVRNHASAIQSIMVNSYNLTDQAFVDFLRQMHEKGVAITVVVDQSTTKIPAGCSALEELLVSGVDAFVFNPHGAISAIKKIPLANHAKFILWTRYDKKTKIVVKRFLAGSANFTSNALRNYEQSVVGECDQIFKELERFFVYVCDSKWSQKYSVFCKTYNTLLHKFLKPSDALEYHYTIPEHVGAYPVSLKNVGSYCLTTINHSFIKTVACLCENMQQGDELCMCVYTFDSKEIFLLVHMLAEKGVKISLIVDKKNCMVNASKIKKPQVELLKNLVTRGVQVRIFDGHERSSVHAKFVLIATNSATCVIEGSANMTFLADCGFNQFLIHVNQIELYKQFKEKYQYIFDSNLSKDIPCFLASKRNASPTKKRLNFTALQDDR